MQKAEHIDDDRLQNIRKTSKQLCGFPSRRLRIGLDGVEDAVHSPYPID